MYIHICISNWLDVYYPFSRQMLLELRVSVVGDFIVFCILSVRSTSNEDTSSLSISQTSTMFGFQLKST